MDLNQIYLGDCMDLIPEIPDGSIDAILTDPPYGVKYQSNWCAEGPRFDPLLNDDTPCTGWIPEGYRILAEDGCLLTFCRWDVQETFKSVLEAAGFRVKSQVVWDRGATGMGDLKGAFAPRHDVAWFATKSRSFKFSGPRPPSVLSFPRASAQSLVHPPRNPSNYLSSWSPPSVGAEGRCSTPF